VAGVEVWDSLNPVVLSCRFVRHGCFGNSSIIRSCFILQLSCHYSFEDGRVFKGHRSSCDTTMELDFINRMIKLSNDLTYDVRSCSAHKNYTVHSQTNVVVALL
jgi:hypothetical protein